MILSDSFRIATITILCLNKFSSSLKHDISLWDPKIHVAEYSKHINDFARQYCLRPFTFKGNIINLPIPEDAKLSLIELAKKYGHPCKVHHIVSSDGYICKVFHLPGDKKRSVLIYHGIFDSSDSFVLRGNGSMAITLANKGYDVWLGNMRGNKYCRKHKTLDPDRDSKFWDFSYHEMALYDLPATIDYILKHTGEKKLFGIGHSLGNCIFYAMTSMLPQYNKKIKLFISLAPAVYIQNIKSPLRALIPFAPLINYLLKSTGNEELLRNGTTLQKILQQVCRGLPGYILCFELLLFTIVGRNEAELEREFMPVVLGHDPSGTSRKNFYHLAQSGKYRRFALFDAGIKENLQIYGSEVSPVYNLEAVNMPVAIFTGKNDILVVVEDTERLRRELPNVVGYTILAPEKVTHLDFIWGRTASRYLFPFIFELLEKY